MVYSFKEIEKKWQSYWEKNKSFQTPSKSKGPKYYILDMFPYPSGAGLHVGHPEGYTATDIVARYKRMQGFHVLHPMGWDAFGLPAERYAMQTGIHPKETTKKNIDNFRRQLKSLGFSYDWDREVNTTDSSYVRWTQFIFLKMFDSYYDEVSQKALPISKLKIPKEIENNTKEKIKYINSKRLAYQKKAPVNWCPELATILANEEVEEWASKGYTVERKTMKQWMLRITAYAERLLNDLKNVDWPTGTLELQKNWIGRSQGAKILFPLLKKTKEQGYIEVFSTRPDTIFGVSFLVLAPEHPLVLKICTKENKQKLEEYIKETSQRSERERLIHAEKEEKTGVFTGAYVSHPFLSPKKIPVWIADYVLLGYGTGAIMAVPAHDKRDHAFAKKFNLEIQQVVSPSKKSKVDIQKEAFVGEGVSCHSDFLNELPTSQAISKTIEELEKKKLGFMKINYKLRDWLFSRQRYWGEPIPISYDTEGNYHPASYEDLPLTLPEIESFKPGESGQSPLANAKEWLEHKNLEGKVLYRETNTMPQWAGSCWYYLRFIDPKNENDFVSPKEEKYWMGKNGIDLYVGGSEHAVLHLLYSRFWHKFLYDYSYVSTLEPFHKLIHQGIILGEDGNKMSKSLGNVVNPDEIINEYGADSFRLFEMFLGPLEQSKPWSSKAITGLLRFLDRVWRLYILADSIDPKLLEEPSKEITSTLHQLIEKVTKDIEKLSFNTAIASLMTFVNEVYHNKGIGKEGARIFIILLSPFAPHITEELWSFLGERESLSKATWPKYDPQKTQKEIVTIVLQINSKIKKKLSVPYGIDEKSLEQLAKEDPQIKKITSDKEIVRCIVVKNRLVNLICK